MYNRGETCGYLWDSAGDNHGDESWDRPLTCEDVVHRLWKKEICPRNRPFTSGRTPRVPEVVRAQGFVSVVEPALPVACREPDAVRRRTTVGP